MDTKIGSVTLESKIDTKGVEKGSQEIKKDFDSVAEAAGKAVEKVNQEFKDFDTSQMDEMTKRTAEAMKEEFSDAADKIRDSLDDLPDSYKTVYAKIEKIRADDTLDEVRRLEKISEQYELLGQDQEDAFNNAWRAIGLKSEKGSREVIENLKKISQEAKETGEEIEESLGEGLEKGLGAGGGTGIKNSIIEGITESLAGRSMQLLEQVGEALLEFGKESIELGSDLQEVQNVVDVTFTSMSGKVNEFALDAAKSAGLSETMAKKYVGTFGAMADSFGFSEQKAYEMSTTLTQLTGDVASFYNLDHDEAYDKLKAVFTGETEALKELGVVMTQTALDDYAMRNGFKKTVAQMTEQEKVSLRYSFVLEQLDAATGDFVRTQDGWANQTRILNLQWESFQATIGKGLINAFSGTLQYINNKFMPALQDAAEGFAAIFDPTPADELRDKLRDLAESFDGVTDKLGEASAEIAANAAMAEYCVDQLEELEAAGLNTAEAQTKYNMTVDRLSELLPDLGLHVDQNTGLINMSTDAIRANIEELKNYAEEQAKQEAIKSYYDAYYESLKAVYEAQYELIRLESEAAGIYEKLSYGLGITTDELKNLSVASVASGIVLKDQAGNIIYLTEEQEEWAKELQKTRVEMSGLNAEMGKANEESEKLGQKADQMAELLGTTADRAQRAAESQNVYSSSLTDAQQNLINIIEGSQNAANTQGVVSDAMQETQKTAETLATSYDTAGQAAQASADQQAQAFDAAAQSNTASTETIVKNAENITAGYQKHTQTITNQFEQFNKTFLESSEVFAQATDAELQKLTEIAEEFAEVAEEFNAMYEQMQETSADTLDSIGKDFDKTFDSIYSSVRSDISSIQSSINSLTGKSVNVTVTTTYVTKYQTIGSPPSTTGSGGSSGTYNAAPALAAAYEPAAMNALPVAEPYLAEGTVVPPMATFPAAAAFSSMRSANNEELIREIVRAENTALSDGLDDVNENLNTLIGIVSNMNLDGNMIFNSYNDRDRKMAIVRGVKR